MVCFFSNFCIVGLSSQHQVMHWITRSLSRLCWAARYQPLVRVYPIFVYIITEPSSELSLQEERDGTIITWTKSQVENHLQYLQYMQSKAVSQHASEVLKQYDIVSGMIQDLSGPTEAVDCDGPSDCTVTMVS